MRVRAIDGAGDWTYGKGQNDYLTANAAVAQNIETRLLSFIGDCFFDLGAGLDWFTFLGSKDQLALNLAVSAVILNTVGVTGVKQILVTLDPSSRKLTIQYRVQTVYSVLTDTFQYDLNGTV